jgi:hypothetical protein
VVSDEATRLKSLRLSMRTSSTGKQFIAGQGSVRARALGRIAHTKIKRFIELTGTPAPNGLINLWGQMWFLDAGARLGRTFESFRNRWFQRSFDGYSVDPLPYANVEIQDKLRDLCLAIDAKDYFDLAEPIVNDIYVDLPPKARIKYNEMEKDMFTELEGREVEAFSAAARTQKCLQLANGAAYVNAAAGEEDPRSKEWRVVHDAKLEALDSCVENANGMPQIVSYEFKSDKARILKAFPKFVDLATDSGWDTFMRGKSPGGLAHPKSLGHGTDGLQNVTNIITHFGQNWDLELYAQINERAGPVRQMQAGSGPAVLHQPHHRPRHGGRDGDGAARVEAHRAGDPDGSDENKGEQMSIADWLIERAKRTPYFHLHHGDGSLYMERYWLVPFASDKEGCRAATWREPLTWLLQRLGVAVRLHVIHTPDLDRALHDHPWTFVSLVLRGWYREERPTTPHVVNFNKYAEPMTVKTGPGPLTLAQAVLIVNPPLVEVVKEHCQAAVRGPGSLALRRFYHRHRISAVSRGGVVTLFVSFRKRQTWGFFTESGKVWWWAFESAHNTKPITAKEQP